jgi:SAM-dependent methyltransferase
MASLYSRSKRLFNGIMGARAKQWFWSRSNPLSGAAARMKLYLAEQAPHDEVYNTEYYAKHDEGSRRSAAVIAEAIQTQFHPATVIDVGCGSGAMLLALRERGIIGRGLEYSEAGIEFCRARDLDVVKFDLESGAEFEGTADVVVSTEVAEHLPERCADRYVDLLCRAAPAVVFTAAPPGQGGLDHINEQPNSYWITKFQDRGFSLRQEVTEAWRTSWAKRGVERWYSENIMVFERDGARETPAGAAAPA